MKTLDLKGYKRLLPENYRVKNDSFGNRRYWALSEDIKTLNWKEVGTLAISETEKKKSYRFLEF